MDTTCLDHQLTPEERQAFDTQGYFIIENALDADQCSDLIEASKQADADFRQNRWLRFRDDMSYAEQYRDTCNPIQSQLLFPPEIWGPGSGDNLPLKKWMEENLTEKTTH